MTFPEPVLSMLAEAGIVRVATRTPDGRPHAAPFWFHFDGERIVLDTLENATVRNLRSDERTTVLVDLGRLFGDLRGATIRGRARVFGSDDAPAPVLAAIDAIREQHAAEIATSAFERYAERETRPLAFVEILPVDCAWYDLGLPAREATR